MSMGMHDYLDQDGVGVQLGNFEDRDEGWVVVG